MFGDSDIRRRLQSRSQPDGGSSRACKARSEPRVSCRGMDAQWFKTQQGGLKLSPPANPSHPQRGADEEVARFPSLGEAGLCFPEPTG